MFFTIFLLNRRKKRLPPFYIGRSRFCVRYVFLEGIARIGLIETKEGQRALDRHVPKTPFVLISVKFLELRVKTNFSSLPTAK